MKKQITIISIAALMLSACGGGANQNSGGNKAQVDTITAFQIYQMVDPEKAATYKDTVSSDRLFFSWSYTDEEAFAMYDINTLLLSHNDGGYLVIAEEDAFDEQDNLTIHYFKFYRYNDGKLTEINTTPPTANSFLPSPSVNEYAAIDAVAFYDPTGQPNVGPMGLLYKYDFTTQLLVISANPYYVDQFALYYKWNGSKFVLDHKSDLPGNINLISAAGLGRIFVGDNPPEKLEGFQSNTLGKAMYFNRDGKKMFKLSLNADGKIDTITVLSDLYTYRIDVDGPSNTHVGIGFKPINYGFWGTQEYFKFKDNNWVRTIPGCADQNLHSDFIPPNYDTLGVIEFYTTKDGIKNIYPENGKIVTFSNPNSERPEFDENATITLIKIYHGQPDVGRLIFSLLLKEHANFTHDNNMIGIYDRDIKYYDKNKTPDGYILNEWGSVQIYNHSFKYFPLNSGGYKVYEYFAWEQGHQYDYHSDPFDPTHFLYCYIYKDGTLTPTALEPEIPSDISASITPFTDKGLGEFVWNGERMIKPE